MFTSPTPCLPENGSEIERSLDAHGYAVLPGLLRAEDCAALAALCPQEGHFRSRIVMARHGFGHGEYQYFAYPLPRLLARLRSALYPLLAPIANRWNRQLGIEVRYPADLDAFLARCHQAGQRRPTPLLGTSGQQRAEVVPLRQGDAVVFTVNQRPVPGQRGGTRKAAMRHGVSRIHSGKRHTAGLIFHDAR